MLSAAVPRRNGREVVCLCWLLAAGCFTCTALAQYRVECWTTDNGLPYNRVYGLWQARDGYLWLTTPDGVARFDGCASGFSTRATPPA
jgi:ligand-binding sensor domain-containing protein